MSKHPIFRIINIFAFIAIFMTVIGCQTLIKHSTYYNADRYWDCNYVEEYSIQTEPEGCRIYVQNEFKGESPVTGKIKGINFRMTQTGTYAISYDQNYWTCKRSPKRVEETIWRPLTPKFDSHTYTIKAFKPGYYPYEKLIKISSNSSVFRQAVANASVFDGNRMVDNFTGRRKLLLVLKPIPGTKQVLPKEQPQQQQQQQQQTVILQGNMPDSINNKGYGTVLVSSLPENGDVYLDGIFVGNAPTKLTLKEGIHVIEVKKDGFESFKRELRILTNSELSIRAVLDKE